MKFEKKCMKKPFYTAGDWIAQKLLLRSGTKYRRLEQDLAYICTNSQRDNLKNFMAKKIALVLMVLFWGCGLCILAQLVGESQRKAIMAVKRPAYGQGEQQTELEVQIEGNGEKKILSIQVGERQYTEKEVKILFGQLKRTMKKTVQGNNDSLQEVRSQLNFPRTFEDGSIEAEWFTDNPELLDSNGNIIGEPKKTGSKVEVTVRFKYRQWGDEYHFSVRIYPKELKPDEKLVQSIEEAVAEADKGSIFEEELLLPTEVNGEALSWKEEGASTVVILVAVVILTAVCLFQREDERIRSLVKNKMFELRMDYPTLLYKLTVLLCAGLTIRASFEKIAENYRQRIKRGDTYKRFAYEEIVYCCNEMRSGVPEAQAYENFGKRCRLSEYIRLGSVLSQNLKKGSQGLAAILEAQAAQSMEERRSLAKKLGEQAGTKLLFPMMLMLMVVMAILMVPAFMSFSLR